ncbi:hypothetical protein GDO81_012206 [Engystomops pustulosus]|uniref:Uncharacterized protein n=1 Tax=Engystomops pustulosus TaxID=76066 RepID=A0AAV7BJT9_ENGPU|nr:hypothetical protein GDO81_012206 [Engystomops pustulosus]
MAKVASRVFTAHESAHKTITPTLFLDLWRCILPPSCAPRTISFPFSVATYYVPIFSAAVKISSFTPHTYNAPGLYSFSYGSSRS